MPQSATGCPTQLVLTGSWLPRHLKLQPERGNQKVNMYQKEVVEPNRPAPNRLFSTGMTDLLVSILDGSKSTKLMVSTSSRMPNLNI